MSVVPKIESKYILADSAWRGNIFLAKEDLWRACIRWLVRGQGSGVRLFTFSHIHLLDTVQPAANGGLLIDFALIAPTRRRWLMFNNLQI